MKNNGTAPATTLTLGAVRRQLEVNGYTAVSAQAPYGYVIPTRGMTTTIDLKPLSDFFQSEHDAAVLCDTSRPLGAMVVRPSANEELSRRVAEVLSKHRLTGGPHRVGSDGVVLYPVKVPDWRASSPSETSSGDVSFHFKISLGRYNGSYSEVIALNGKWRGSLLDTPYDRLPEASNRTISVVLREISAQSRQLEQERRPAPPPPTKFGWLGR